MGKKHFNNLYDSILITLLLVVVIVLAVISVYACSLYQNWKVAVAIGALFGSVCIASIVLILIYGYQYWTLENDRIILKKLLGKPQIMFREQITSIQKKKVRTILNYSCDAFVIETPTTRIAIFVNKGNKEILETYFKM